MPTRLTSSWPRDYLVGTPIDSLYTYAMTKRMLYVGLLALHNSMVSVSLPGSFHFYGPGYHTDGQMHFIFDLIRKIMRGKLHGEPVVPGATATRAGVVLVDDFVRIA